MRTFELRVYTLRSQEALAHYEGEIWPRHLHSFPRFGIQPHGIWTEEGDAAPRAFVLVSYAEGAEPGEVILRYMASQEFASEVEDWDRSNIVAVHSTVLRPAASSPLQ